jgi:hypothetical protein
MAQRSALAARGSSSARARSEWHQRKVLTKLGISVRRELSTALPDLDGPAPQA